MVKTWFCGDSPLCFEEINQLFKKEENQIFKSADIFSNLKHNHFNPFEKTQE